MTKPSRIDLSPLERCLLREDVARPLWKSGREKEVADALGRIAKELRVCNSAESDWRLAGYVDIYDTAVHSAKFFPFNGGRAQLTELNCR